MSGSDSPTFFHGQPWSSWIEKIGRDKPLSDDEPDTEPASSVMRLSVDDIDLYGFCPERDTFYGVVCEICNSIVKPQALIQHMESRHPSGLPSIPTPTNNTSNKQLIKTPYCKLSKLKKSQTTGQLSLTNNGTSGSNNSTTNNKTSNNHTPVKQRTIAAEQQSNNTGIPSASPRSPLESSSTLSTGQSPSIVTNSISSSGNSPVKSPGNQPKRKRIKPERSLLKDREYDPDRHCGVWNDETGKPCTRSLTCKAHTVSLRRHVTGRSKSFDKLLADHRASKELPNTRTQTKITSATTVTVSSTSVSSSTAMPTTVLGTISVSIPELSTASALTPSTPIVNAVTASAASLPELDTPSSPPVLSLPDTYPLDKYPHLPQAVDLLYRCLDPPHGSNKPSKLEENFNPELDSNRRVESSVVNNTSTSNSNVASSSTNNISNNPAMAPISVVLPSLSPIPTGSMSPQTPLLQFSRNSPAGVDQIVNKPSPASIPVAPTVLPLNNQPTSSTTVALEAKTAPMDIDSSQNITMYTSSPLYKDGSKSQVTVQISRTNVVNKMSTSRNYSNLFDSISMDHSTAEVSSRTANHVMTNGNLSNHFGIQNNQPIGRARHDYTQDYSAALQLEATPASATPFTTFDDISWSNCHPEPLAVTKWLRINSSRKQYNFNIH